MSHVESLGPAELRGSFDSSGYQIDHIEEQSLTGNDRLENLQALCPASSTRPRVSVQGNCELATATVGRYATRSMGNATVSNASTAGVDAFIHNVRSGLPRAELR